jgi:two-component system, sensor histidine kinase and response regulator
MLIDMGLQGDGLSLVQSVRARCRTSPGFIMMLTSASHRADAQSCRAAGIGSYVVKPFRAQDLQELLVRTLGDTLTSHRPATPSHANVDVAAGALNILLAEDNAVNQMVMQRLLGKRGHRVVVAGNGRMAVEMCNAERFDLIFMDVQMPEMDGLQATREIRRQEGKGKRTPIVALTAHAMSGDRERCLQAGMDNYITKPVNPKELDEMLEQYSAPSNAAARSA